MTLSRRTVALLALPLLASCGRDARTGPPSIRLGRDECAECGMAIHEDRSSAAILVKGGTYLLFDDIGCLLDIERSRGSSLEVVGRYVHDHAEGAWLTGESATYLVTDGSTLHTPMSSGLAAFVDAPAAENARQKHGGRVVDFRELVESRRAWAEARRKAAGG